MNLERGLVKIAEKSKPHKCMNIHIAVDPNTGEFAAQRRTSSHVLDGKVISDLLDQNPFAN